MKTLKINRIEPEIQLLIKYISPTKFVEIGLVNEYELNDFLIQIKNGDFIKNENTEYGILYNNVVLPIRGDGRLINKEYKDCFGLLDEQMEKLM